MNKCSSFSTSLPTLTIFSLLKFFILIIVILIDMTWHLIVASLFLFLLKDNCFTILCWPLPYINITVALTEMIIYRVLLFYLKVLSVIIDKVPLPCKVIYSQVPGIRAWMSLRLHDSTEHISGQTWAGREKKMKINLRFIHFTTSDLSVHGKRNHN